MSSFGLRMWGLIYQVFPEGPRRGGVAVGLRGFGVADVGAPLPGVSVHGDPLHGARCEVRPGVAYKDWELGLRGQGAGGRV